MVSIVAQRASDSVFELAESPLWNPDTQRVLWVDIPSGQLHSGSLHDSTITDTERVSFGAPITSVSLSSDGGLLVSGQRELMTVDDGGTVRRSPDLLPSVRRNRMNDGACDAQGRLLIGTLALDDSEYQEELLQVAPHGSISNMRSHIGLSNGIAWSPDGGELYHVDSIARKVWAAHYDAATGAATQWRSLFTVDGGLPDGIAVDAEGMLWVAVWGAGEVRRYDVKGNALSTVRVAAPHTSSVAFAGRMLDQLVITTARSELTRAELSLNPDSGAIFLADPGVSGIPVFRWGGSTRDPQWPAGGRSALDSRAARSHPQEEMDANA